MKSDLDAVHGVMNSFLISIVFWALVIGMVWCLCSDSSNESQLQPSIDKEETLNGK